MKNKILIFRNQLFKISESFITNQSESLTSFHPIYIGRKVFGEAPCNYDVVTLDKYSLIENLKYVLFRSVKIFKNQLNHYEDIKLIHAHFGVEGVYGLQLAAELNIPLITTFHGFDATTTSRSLLISGKPAWINYLIFRKRLIEKGDLFICVSEFIRQKVLDLGFPEDRTITHYIGIDVSKPVPKKKIMEDKIILHVARLTEKKGTKYLLDAFASIIQKNLSTKLIVIGDGPLLPKLKRQVFSLGISNQVSFLGSQPRSIVMDWMCRSDIFCLPSITAQSGDSEGLGMVFLEASSAKVPIVGTYHGGIPEAVNDGITGFLVPEKDSVALADKLDMLLNDEELRLKMGGNARKFVEEKFNLKTQTKKLEQLYKSVLQ